MRVPIAVSARSQWRAAGIPSCRMICRHAPGTSRSRNEKFWGSRGNMPKKAPFLKRPPGYPVGRISIGEAIKRGPAKYGAFLSAEQVRTCSE